MMTHHSASETVRGDLLSIEDCAKQLKECRRTRHRLLSNRSEDSGQCLRSLGYSELALRTAQRLLASGLEVYSLAGNLLMACATPGVPPDGHTPTYLSTQCSDDVDGCVCPHDGSCLAVAALRGPRGAHIWVSRRGCLAVSKELLWRSPRLVLRASEGWLLTSDGFGAVLGPLGERLARYEASPGRAHARVLRWVEQAGEARARACAAGPDGAVLLAAVPGESSPAGVAFRHLIETGALRNPQEVADSLGMKYTVC